MKNVFLSLFTVLLLMSNVKLYSQSPNSNIKTSLGLIAYTSFNSGSLGFVYNATSNFIIKPSFSFYQQDNSVKDYSGKLEFDYYFLLDNNLYFFSGMALGYSYSYSNYMYSNGDTAKASNHNYSTSIIIGTQYMFNKKFGLFVDAGINYTRRHSKFSNYDKSDSSVNNGNSQNNIFSTSGFNLGAIFYLM